MEIVEVDKQKKTKVFQFRSSEEEMALIRANTAYNGFKDTAKWVRYAAMFCRRKIPRPNRKARNAARKLREDQDRMQGQ